MFVFPAFNKNYKTRKRTFQCCLNCRIKRVKCDIQNPDYEAVGCANCRKQKWQCDLVKEQPRKKRSIDKQSTAAPVPPPSHPSLISSQTSLGRSSGALPKAEGKILPQFLKTTFGFNVSGHDSSSQYQYVFHDHPKAIINQDNIDRLVYHESGVYIDLAASNKGGPILYKVRTFSGMDMDLYIRDPRTYQYLAAIHAFTLSSPEFQFSQADEHQLVELYFRKFNLVFPIVHAQRFWDDYHEGKAQTILVYAMVLVISRDNLAQPILRRVFDRSLGRTLSEDEYNDHFVLFMTDLEQKIRQVLMVLPQLGDIDKLTKLVVHLLLSQHFKFDRLGNEHSSHDFTAALNLAGSLAIQMKPHRPISREKETYANNLWWICYVFDRLNAVVNCRFVFIRHDDFNVELPYNNPQLMKLVQLAVTFEKMLFAFFQPFDNSHRRDDSKETREKLFDIEEFQRIEFELCAQERAQAAADPAAKLGFEAGDYIENSIDFLRRMMNNVVIIASQKSRYDDPRYPNHIIDGHALQASLNILFYLNRIHADNLMNIPLVCWCITVAMSCLLKRHAKEALRTERTPLPPVDYTLQDYLDTLERFSSKWWVLDEIHSLTTDFVRKLKLKENDLPRPEPVRYDSEVLEMRTPQLADFASPLAHGGNYDSYLESVHIDMFDNEFFKDLPQVMNFLE